MGLFGDDKRQDERLDALEQHIRILTETVQQNQLDIAVCRIGMLAIQAEIETAAKAIKDRLDEKVSSSEIDPVLKGLNTELGQARVRLEESSEAAVETWGTLQGGLRDAFDALRTSLEDAADSAKRI